MKRYFIVIISLVALLIGACSTAEAPSPTSSPTPTPTTKPKLYSEPPQMIIDTNKSYTAIIETEKGNITLELFAKDMPVTVNNFVFLAREGFYDNCTFHRIIADFMAQGGDPTGTGTGWPGYYFATEISQHTHVAGALSMANGGVNYPNTNGCQFFITFTPQHHLDGLHPVFGQLIDGWDVLWSLTLRNPEYNPQYEGDTIFRITIEES